MTSIVRPTRRATAVLALAGTLALAGCGGTSTATQAAASPTVSQAPAATVAPASGPPAASAAPTDSGPLNPRALGLFAVNAEDAVAFYAERGFDCQDPQPSTQAAGYLIVRCLRENAETGTTDLVGLVHTTEGILGNAFAGILTPAGTDGPTVPIAYAYLAEFLGVTLGEGTGTKAADWYGASLGKETERTAIDGLVVQHYRQDDGNGVGRYVEIANEWFLTAPSP